MDARLIQSIVQIVSDLQTICTKSDEPQASGSKPKKKYAADELYRQVADMISQMVREIETGKYELLFAERKKELLGEKATILDAVNMLTNLALKDKELRFKYKRDEASKPVQKKITQDDLAMIKEFIQRMPDENNQ